MTTSYMQIVMIVSLHWRFLWIAVLTLSVVNRHNVAVSQRLTQKEHRKLNTSALISTVSVSSVIEEFYLMDKSDRLSHSHSLNPPNDGCLDLMAYDRKCLQTKWIQPQSSQAVVALIKCCQNYWLRYFSLPQPTFSGSMVELPWFLVDQAINASLHHAQSSIAAHKSNRIEAKYEHRLGPAIAFCSLERTCWEHVNGATRVKSKTGSSYLQKLVLISQISLMDEHTINYMATLSKLSSHLQLANHIIKIIVILNSMDRQTEHGIAIDQLPRHERIEYISLLPRKDAMEYLMQPPKVTNRGNSKGKSLRPPTAMVLYHPNYKASMTRKLCAVPVSSWLCLDSTLPVGDILAAYRKSTFVVVDPSLLSSTLLPSLLMCKFDVRVLFTLSEILLSNAIPIVVNAPCLQAFMQNPVNRYSTLPVLFYEESDLLTEANSSTRFASYLLNVNLAASTIAANKTHLSSLFLPYWLDRILPFDESERHVARGITKHKAFLTAIDEVSVLMVKSPEYVHICGSAPPLSKTGPSTLQIVLPRCCESALSDLAWVEPLLKKFRSIAVSVYYKCPFCIPENKVQAWLPTIAQMSLVDPSLSRILNSKLGIRVLNDLPNGVKEFMAFDSTVNGKEVTAYLTHIVSHYPNNLTDAVMFLHTQPAHHLDFGRFTRALSYYTLCKNTKGLVPPEFLYLNYRWFEGVWAHQPEVCSLHLLKHMLSDSKIMGDDKRFRSSWLTNEKLYMSQSMAAAAAAQFVVTKQAILQRSTEFWERLIAVNRGKPSIRGCNHRDYLKGSEVASAMERLWHNFFQDGSRLSNPLYLPRISKDPNIPPYLAIETEFVLADSSADAIIDTNKSTGRQPQSFRVVKLGDATVVPKKRPLRTKVNRINRG